MIRDEIWRWVSLADQTGTSHSMASEMRSTILRQKQTDRSHSPTRPAPEQKRERGEESRSASAPSRAMRRTEDTDRHTSRATQGKGTPVRHRRGARPDYGLQGTCDL